MTAYLTSNNAEHVIGIIFLYSELFNRHSKSSGVEIFAERIAFIKVCFVSSTSIAWYSTLQFSHLKSVLMSLVSIDIT